MQSIDSSDQHGGAASADRQCQFTKSDGFRCRDWALRGHQHCFRHHQYLQGRPENPIDVPLLEDEDSLAALLSQTLRALAWGTLAPANGRAILAGCRIMQGMLNHRLAKAKFHVKVRRLDMMDIEEELLDREPQPNPEPESEQGTGNPQPVTRNPVSVTCDPQPVTSNPVSVTRNPQPVTRNPASALRNADLLRIEEEMRKVLFPDHQPTLEPFRVSHAVPVTATTIEELAAAMAR